jgi:hypothetical protein
MPPGSCEKSKELVEKIKKLIQFADLTASFTFNASFEF